MGRRAAGEEPDDVGAPGEWADQASCSGMSVLLLDFFGKTRVDWGLSKEVCRSCPVRRECASYALAAGNVHGVWGGMDPLELRFALGRDAAGEPWQYQRQDVKCVYCRDTTTSERLDDATVLRKCTTCGFAWERNEREKPKRKRRTTAGSNSASAK